MTRTNRDDVGFATVIDGGCSGWSVFDIDLGDRVDLIDYAARKQEAECMARAGYPQLRDAGVLRFDHEATKLVLDVQRALGYASEEDARTRGFGRSEGPKSGQVISFDPNFDRAFDQCRAEVAEILDTGERGLFETYKSLGAILNLEFGVLWAQDRFAADFAELADCMVASGNQILDRQAFIDNDMATAFGITLGSLEDVPEARWEPARVPGTVAVGPPIPARRYVPTPAEAELAVVWYRCDQQSGRVEMGYRAPALSDLYRRRGYTARVGDQAGLEAAQSTYDSAQDAYTTAQGAYDEAQAAHDAAVRAGDDVAEAKAAVDEAKAALDKAQAALDKATTALDQARIAAGPMVVRSEIMGVSAVGQSVTAVSVAVGAVIESGDVTLLELDSQPPYVSVFATQTRPACSRWARRRKPSTKRRAYGHGCRWRASLRRRRPMTIPARSVIRSASSSRTSRSTRWAGRCGWR